MGLPHAHLGTSRLQMPTKVCLGLKDSHMGIARNYVGRLFDVQ